MADAALLMHLPWDRQQQVLSAPPPASSILRSPHQTPALVGPTLQGSCLLTCRPWPFAGFPKPPRFHALRPPGMLMGPG